MKESWHSWKGRRERKKQLYWERLWDGSSGAKSDSPLCVTDTRWQRFAAQLLALQLRFICYQFLTPRCLTIDSLGLCIYVWLCVSGWGRWRRRRVQDGGGGGPANPCDPLPLPPCSPPLWEKPRPALWSRSCWISRVGPRGKILLICVEFYYFRLFGSWWLRLSFPSLFLRFTLSRKHRPSSLSLVRLSVWLSATLLPSLPSAASPLLITPINIFNFCHFSPQCSPPLCLIFLFHTGRDDSSYGNCNLELL